MRITIFKYLPAISFISVLTGCATFQSQPISPSQTASAFESRILDSPELKKFLETNLKYEISPWPPKSWDFTMLTLTAFYYHPDMDLARAKFGIAEAGIITAGEIPNPSIGFKPTYNAASGGLSPWTLGFNLDIPVETAGKRGYRIARAKHLSEAAKLNIAETVWKVRSRLRSIISNYLLSVQNLELLKAEEAIRAEYVSLLEIKLELGDIPGTDVESARINLSRTRLIVKAAEGRVDETSILLAESLGVPVSAVTGIVLSYPPMDTPPSIEAIPEDNVQQEALLNRLDIRRTLSEYSAAEASLQLEIAKQYPDIHLGPGYTWDQGDNKWSIGFSLTLPIFNRNAGPIAQANAHRDEAAASFLSLQARVIGEINKAVSNYHSAVKEYETAANLLFSVEKRESDIEQTFALGDADYTAVVGAKLETIIAGRSRIDAFKKAQTALGSMEDAVQKPLGQGLSMPAIPEIKPRTQIPLKEKVMP